MKETPERVLGRAVVNARAPESHNRFGVGPRRAGVHRVGALSPTLPALSVSSRSEGVVLATAINAGVRSVADRLSPAAITRYRTCPKRFFFQDVERRPQRAQPSPVLANANAVHQALERFFGLAQEHRRVEVLHRALRWAWQFHRKGAFRGEAEERAYGDQALAMLSTFAESFDLTVVPLAREQWVSCRLEQGGTEVFGKVDRIDPAPRGNGIELVDYKTGRRQLEPEDLKDEPAAQVYVVAAEAEYRRPVERVRFIYLPTGTEVAWTPEREDVAAARDALATVTNEIRSATDFPAYPGAQCRWCPYALVCPDRGRVDLTELEPAEGLPF